VLTFEPHPRDYFAQRSGRPDTAPARIATLRDKLGELERCGIDRVVVARFDDRFASQTPQQFIADVLVQGLGARYVLVGDDFRFGARRAGTYAMLDEAGTQAGFDVARMLSYEVHGLRVSSSAVRDALAAGRMADAAALLGRPYTVSGHAIHGRKLGRELGFRTLNLRFHHPGRRRWASSSCVCTAWAMRRCRAWPAWACARPSRMPAACCWRCTACSGRRGWGWRTATDVCCASNCCTSCTTSAVTNRWTPCRPASRATPTMLGPGGAPRLELFRVPRRP
jgi:hypothetical protein